MTSKKLSLVSVVESAELNSDFQLNTMVYRTSFSCKDFMGVETIFKVERSGHSCWHKHR